MKHIRDAVSRNCYAISWHARERMRQRNIREDRILQVLKYGSIVEQNKSHTMEYKLRHGTLHVVVSVREGHSVTIMSAY